MQSLKPFGLLFLAALIFTSLSRTNAENWNGWRGPRGDGTSNEANLPTQWDGSTGNNIAWKVKLPGSGHSSPIVWENRVLVTACDELSNERLLLCLDRRDGRTIWQTTVLKTDLESKHQLNSYASGTPTTDGEFIYSAFLETNGPEEPAKNVGSPRMIRAGNMITACFDMQGNQKWVKNLGRFTSAHGFCSSPLIYKDLVIVNGDHDGNSYVFALNSRTGEIVWKFPRVHQTRSYCTPIIRTVAGKTQLVMSGSKQVISLDPNTGKQWWYVDGPTEQFVASMVFDGTNFYLAAGYPDHFVMAINPNGSGDVTKSHVAWSSTEAKCYVPSPVLAAQRLFVVDDRGTMNCFEPKTGYRLWQSRLGGHYSASLVTANELVYCTADDGVVKVIRPGDTLTVLSANPLGENSFASPAISQGQIFIRGEQHLFAIGR